jgi:hypothetical protein
MEDRNAKEAAMARVTGFEQQNLHRSRIYPTETECDYAIFDDGGKRYLQISSSGSRDRKDPRGGTTQTYQFDETSARELRRIIGLAFPGLA